MQNPHIKVCGEWAAVGDVNGDTIYMFGVQGMVGSVDTSLSISQIEVAKQGIVAAVLEDTTANYINLYNTDGSKIYTVKTTLAGDGYPLDISISEDATKLIASICMSVVKASRPMSFFTTFRKSDKMKRSV